MFYNIKMKLLIGGKNRNIYMRKDGSAYYKSGGENVDVTHMFKKNGGGLKKQYIKGGTQEEFNNLKVKCIEFLTKLKDIYTVLRDHTYNNPDSKDFIDTMIQTNYDNTSLTNLAVEIVDALEKHTNSSDKGSPNYVELMSLIEKISDNIKKVINKNGYTEIKNDLATMLALFDGNILSDTEQQFNTQKNNLVEKLKFVVEAIEAIEKIGSGAVSVTGNEGEEPPSNAQSKANIDNIDISGLEFNFESLMDPNINSEVFNKKFLDLAQIIISVTNSLRGSNANSINMKVDLKDNLKKLDLIINLLINSSAEGWITRTNEGIFTTDTEFKKFLNSQQFKKNYLKLEEIKVNGSTSYMLKLTEPGLVRDTELMQICVNICMILVKSNEDTLLKNPFKVNKKTIIKNIQYALSTLKRSGGNNLKQKNNKKNITKTKK